MNELPMPSEVRALAVKEMGEAAQSKGRDRGAGVVVEPPSVKMILRLFIIPLLIAAAVVGIMLPIAHLAGGPSSLDAAMDRIKNHGGERTMSQVGKEDMQRNMVTMYLVAHTQEGTI